MKLFSFAYIVLGLSAALAPGDLCAAFEKTPWLGTLFECEAAISYAHTTSKKLDTTRGTVSYPLYRGVAEATLSCMPTTSICCFLEIDAAETSKNDFGFDALQAALAYQMLDDLQDDPVSFTAGAIFTASPKSRIKDITTKNHATCEGVLYGSLGREFAHHNGSFWRLYSTLYAGKACTSNFFSSSPWYGLQVALERAFSEVHRAAVYIAGEQGMSSHRLSSARAFRSWSEVGYGFSEVGMRYKYTLYGWGSFQAIAAKRIYAKYCPTDSWSVQLGVVIPFSPL